MSCSFPAMRRWLALGVVVLAALGGCAAPATTVILLPDEDGHVGAVVVSSGSTSQRVDRAYDAVSTGSGRLSSPASAGGKSAVDAAYADLLKAQPSKPKSFVLNFQLDSTVMTGPSRARIPDIVESAKSRRPTQVIVYGHADATGTEAHNERLSGDRARVVAELLQKADPSLGDIETHACGDRVPLSSSSAHAPEPLNRRVEVVVL